MYATSDSTSHSGAVLDGGPNAVGDMNPSKRALK